MIKKYIKKPVIIDAIQYDGINIREIIDFCGNCFFEPVGADPYINTLLGNMSFSKGDWIIKSAKGEFYPCKDNIFKLIYSEIDDKKVLHEGDEKCNQKNITTPKPNIIPAPQAKKFNK